MSAPRLALILLLAAAPLLDAAEDRIRWVNGMLADALRAATERERPVLVYCWEEEQQACVSLYANTITTETVMSAVEDWVCFNAKKGTPGGDEVLSRYEVRIVPTILFLNAQGELVDLMGGVIPPGQFVLELERVRRGEGTLRELITRAADDQDPGQLEARFLLLFRYRGLGEFPKAEAELNALSAADPKAKTLPGARALFMLVAREAARAAKDDTQDVEWDGQRVVLRGNVKTWPLKPFQDWAKKVQHPVGRFEAYDQLGELELAQERRDAAVSAWQQAEKDVPPRRAFDWCATQARAIMDHPGKPSAGDRKFALKLAQHGVKLAEDIDPASEDFRALFRDQSKDSVIARQLEVLGYALKFNGQHGKAVETLERCVALEPANRQYESSLELIKSGRWPPPPPDEK